MNPGDKELASFIAIGLMLVASLLITFTRLKTKGVVRFILSAIAFLILLIGMLYAIPVFL